MTRRRCVPRRGSITGRMKGYPFEVEVPPCLPVRGVVLSDQVESLLLPEDDG